MVYISCCLNADHNPTHSLYMLSLYQNNSIHILPSLFDNNYSSQVGALYSFLQRFILCSGGVAICVYWIEFWVFRFIQHIRDPVPFDMSPSTPGGYQLIPTFIDGPHDMAIKTLLGLIIFIYPLIGVPPLLGMLWLLKDTIFPKEFSLFAPFVYFRRFIIHRLGEFIKPSTSTGAETNTNMAWGADISFPCRLRLLTYTDPALMSIRVFLHLLIHIILIGAALTCSLFWFGFTIRLGLALNVARDGMATGIFLSICNAFFIFIGFLCLWPVIPVGNSLLEPLRIYLNVRERADMEVSPGSDLRNGLWALGI